MKKDRKTSKKTINKEKIKYILKLVILTIITTLLLELGYVILKSMRETITTEGLEFNQRIIRQEEGFMVVGSSNFKYSDVNKKSGKYEKPRLAFYNGNDQLTKEFKYNKGYNGLFTDAVDNEDSYVAVGYIQKIKEEKENNNVEALIIKYDQNGKIIWEKNYKKVTNAKFNKIIKVNNGYIVVGSSTYNTMERGTEEAGGIIIKYDEEGTILWEEHYGDNKTASFNDILEEKDGYIIVGSKDISTGIMIKYDTNGIFQWKREIENLGTNGLSRIKKINNNYVVIGSFKKSTYIQKKTNTALLVILDTKGNLQKYTEYGEEQAVSQWNDFIIKDNKIYIVGVTSYINEKKSKDKLTYYNNKAIYAVYDMNLKLLDQNEVDKNATYQYTSLIEKKNTLYITGYTNAKCDIKHADGKNYVSFIEQVQK